MDSFWYLVAKEFFADKDCISTALLQRYLGLSYFQARLILDTLIEEDFCLPQVGSYPCKIKKLSN